MTLHASIQALAGKPGDQFIRDSCIKRFEYSYELSHKMLRRYLEATEPATTDQLSFPSLIRLGFVRGVLKCSWDVWHEFRDARNKTSHTYDEAKANDVLRILPAFAAEADFLCAEIGRRQTP
jgi:nucleotidyltransferase substrate binding protein (TIGR01987 family)